MAHGTPGRVVGVSGPTHGRVGIVPYRRCGGPHRAVTMPPRMTSVRHGQPRMVSELPRSLSPIHALAMVVGAIIGAGIFVQPSEISRHLHTPGQIMLVWLGCGIVTLFGAL